MPFELSLRVIYTPRRVEVAKLIKVLIYHNKIQHISANTKIYNEFKVHNDMIIFTVHFATLFLFIWLIHFASSVYSLSIYTTKIKQFKLVNFLNPVLYLQKIRFQTNYVQPTCDGKKMQTLCVVLKNARIIQYFKQRCQISLFITSLIKTALYMTVPQTHCS